MSMRKIGITAWFATILLGLSRALSAPIALAEDPVGVWVGDLKIPGADLHVAVHLRRDGTGALTGSFDSLDQGARGLPLGEVTASVDGLTFTVPSIRGTFTGTWQTETKHWSGTWRQGPTNLPLELARGEVLPAPTIVGLDGDWDGVLDINGTQLRLALHVKTTPADGTTATLDSIDQNALGAPVSAISREGPHVRLELKTLAAIFDGALEHGDQTIAGRWTQGSLSLPLTLQQRPTSAKQPTLNRPQTPQKPYPYAEEEVVFESAAGHARLAGSLTRPKGTGPYPAVVMIAGSGPNTRDEPIMGHRLFLVIADHLTRQGIAVLRYDKRGTGSSTGDYLKATTADFADDADAALGYLATRADIGHRQIGLIGHSEGGLIAPIVAARDPSVAFMVLMAGPGENGAKILSQQGRLLSKAMGLTDAQVETAATLRDQLIAIAETEKDPALAKAKLRALLADSAKSQGLPATAVEQQAAVLSSDWFRFFFTYEPAPTLRKVRCPVLALGGSNDLQVPAEENLASIKAALASNPDAQVLQLPNLNHLFQTARTGSLFEYGQIEETITPSALDLITSWILKHVGVSPGQRASTG
jgi:pimeloyl-ACP methyl ester carboxylesterase